MLSRRNMLTVSAAGAVMTASAARAASFGNPDQPCRCHRRGHRHRVPRSLSATRKLRSCDEAFSVEPAKSSSPRPTLSKQSALPASPKASCLFPSLALSRNTPKYTWDLHHVDGRECAVAFEPRYVTDDMAALRLTAERGNGIVQLPFYMVSEQLRTGSLVAVLPDWESTSGIIHAVFSSRRGQSTALRSFIDFAGQGVEATGQD